jgi:DNA-binding transcriptional LysR family regulator
MLDVKRLRVLREVAERGSFSAAADSLAYTQSAVSQQIAALERESGAKLVDRSARGVRLTDAGRALVEHSDAILARLAAAEQELEDIAGLRGGRVRLATFPSAGATLVPPAIAEFSAAHPGVELSLIEAEPEESLPRLKAGELDVALVLEHSAPGTGGRRADDDIELIRLLDDPLYAALPPGHRLAGKRRLRLSDLAEEIWIQSDVCASCGQLNMAACRAAGFEPRVEFQSDDYNVIQGLVAAGVGVALIAELALTNLRDDIAIRSLGPDTPVRRVCAATLAGGYRSPAVEAMLETLDRAVERYRARAPTLAA